MSLSLPSAFSWHGGQGSALYAFASTRQVQSETHRANTLDEIDADLAKLEIDDTREPGDLPKLRRLRKRSKTPRSARNSFLFDFGVALWYSRDTGATHD